MNSNNKDHEQDFITLTLDDDSELTCAILDVFTVEGKEYIALLPEDDDQVFLYKFSQDDDENANLEIIEDDDEFDKVADAFDELLDLEEFNELLDDEFFDEKEED